MRSLIGHGAEALVFEVDGTVLKERVSKKYRLPVLDILDGQINIARDVGTQVGILHKHDVVHSDLTTSNMILSDGHVHLIDFGLSYVSKKVEDKAVDLHLLHHALESKHHDVHKECMDLVVKGYKEAYSDADKVLERLKVVQKRGRNKK